jgi:hypothetical protein
VEEEEEEEERDEEGEVKCEVKCEVKEEEEERGEEETEKKDPSIILPTLTFITIPTNIPSANPSNEKTKEQESISFISTLFIDIF